MSDPGIREAIEQVSAALLAEPARARVRSAATARLAEGLRFEVTGPREQRVATDMPPPMGGRGSAPNPGWLLRAAVASCLGTVIAMRAAKLGVRLGTLEVTVESESDNRALLGLDDTAPAGLGGWRTQVRIAGDAEAPTLREIAAWAEAHSPVGCTLRNAAPCTLEVAVV